MLSTIAASIVAALSAVLPLLTGAGEAQIASIITLLVNLIPALTNELTSLIPEVQNIITALKGSGAVSPEQMTQLQALDAQCDANFDAASAGTT